jgi:uncharacterized protein (DUF433 family)
MTQRTPLDTIEAALSALTDGEKAQLLQKLVNNLGGAAVGIDTNPAVCGGDARIVRTRIPVWLLVHGRRLGTGEADLLHAYPTLRAEDLVNAWAYERLHRDEIDEHIRANESA